MDKSPTTNHSPLTEDKENPELRFLKRFSSVSNNYKNEERSSVTSFIEATKRESYLHSLSPAEQKKIISEKLRATTAGWKIENTYLETICILFPTMESREKLDSNNSGPLIDFLQRIFLVSTEEHKLLIQSAKQQSVPDWVLNVEVIEAKDLPPMDTNGLSDPFCILSMSTNKEQSYRTAFINETLNPVWNAFFTIPIVSSEESILTIDVMDYDEVQRKREIIKQLIWKPKHGRGTHEFIGCIDVPLKTLEFEVIDKWFPLEKCRGNGQIHLRMAVGPRKDKVEAIGLYRQVLQLLLIYDLEMEDTVTLYEWKGKFLHNNWSDYILRHVSWSGGLKPQHVRMAKWIAYIHVHSPYPLSTNLFPSILTEIINDFSHSTRDIETYREFWNSTKILLATFADFIGSLPQSLANDSRDLQQLRNILITACIIREHVSIEERNSGTVPVTSYQLSEQMKTAASRGARNLVRVLLKEATVSVEMNPNMFSTVLKKISVVGQVLQSILEKGSQNLQLDNIEKESQNLQLDFKKYLNLDWFHLMYAAFDSAFGRAVEPIIGLVCQALNDPDNNICVKTDDFDLEANEEYIAIGNEIFKLYICLKQFSEMSLKLDNVDGLLIPSSFNKWFQPGISHLWDTVWVVTHNCLKRTFATGKSDKMEGVSGVSFSAVSFTSVLNQVPNIWKEMSWPNAEETFNFLFQILVELRKYTLMYADIISENVEKEEENNKPGIYYIPHAVCHNVNNIKYVLAEGFLRVIDRLQVDDVIRSLSVANGAKMSATAADSFNQLKEDCQKSIYEKVSKIFEKAASKMRGQILRFLVDATESEGGMNGYVDYMDKNLGTLNHKLTPCSFQIAFRALWRENLGVIHDLINIGLDNMKGPKYFKDLKVIFADMKNFFHLDDNGKACSPPLQVSDTNEMMSQVEGLLSIHGANVADLKLKYYEGRYERQRDPTPHGILTVNVQYAEESTSLVVHVLNAQKLKSYDSDGLSDPYVEVSVVPTENFRNAKKMSTNVQKSTLFPLFDETFKINISLQEMESGGFLNMAVYDHDLIGTDDFHGEAFLPLSLVTRPPQKPAKLHLNIDKPSEDDMLILSTLEKRGSAAKFVNEEKKKMDRL